MFRSGIGNALASSVISGTTTNDSAPTGGIGQFVTATVASGSAVSLSNGAGTNVTSISVTAGDWDISGTVDIILAGATGTLSQGGISLTTATLPSQAGGSGLGTDGLTLIPLSVAAFSNTVSVTIPPVRLLVAATTTVYLVAQQAFTVGTATAYGTIRARRVR